MSRIEDLIILVTAGVTTLLATGLVVHASGSTGRSGGSG